MPLPVIAELYMLSAIVGTLVLVASAALGGLGRGHLGGGAGHAGHLGGGHGHAGHLGAGQHGGTGHHAIGGHGQASAHHPPGAQTTGHNSAANSSRSGSGESNSGALASTGQLPAAPGKNQSAMLMVLTLLNPTTISAFAIWFGAFGLFSWRLLPFLSIELTLPIALGAGWLGTRLTLTLMSALASRMYASGSFRQEQLIGSPAEVTVSVDGKHKGEITCAANGSRYSFSAHPARPQQSFKRGSRVIISDIRNDTAYIEPWPDEDFPLDDDGGGNNETPTSEPARLPETPN